MKQGHWLALGMLGGLAIALADLLWQPASTLPEDTIAQVGIYVVEKSRFEATARQIEQESRSSLTQVERQALLDRMVDEYLLLDYAKSLDLLTVNPDLRRRAVDLVLQTLREQAMAMEPTDAEIAAFVAANRGYFRTVAGVNKEQALPEGLKDAARQEWQRRQAENMLNSLLADLRAQTRIQQVDKP